MSLKKTSTKQKDKHRLIAALILGTIIVAGVVCIMMPTMPEEEIEYAIQIRLVPLDDESLPSVIEMRDENGSLLERMTVVRGPEEAFAHSTSELGYTLASLEGCTVDTGDHLITMHVTDFELTVGTLEFGDAMSASYEYDDYIVSVILWEDE